MKTAKEWAESVVRGQVPGTKSYLWLDDGQCPHGAIVGDHAVPIIERLVERVQADARAPLEEQIARLREERERDIAAVEALVDATTGEEDSRLIKAVDILVQRINAWRAEQP